MVEPVSFEQFVKLHLRDLERYAARYAVLNGLPAHYGQDILVEALVITLEHWPDDLKHQSDSRRRAFTCRTMQNVSRNVARRERKSTPCPPDYFHQCDAVEQVPTDSAVFVAVATRLVYAASLQLPERERQVFQLVAIAELDIDEVAFQLDMTKSAVSSALSRARKRIKRMLPKGLVDELGLRPKGGGSS